MNDIVVDCVRRQKFAEIETVCLFQELGENDAISHFRILALFDDEGNSP